MNRELLINDRTPVIIAQEINIIREQAGKILLQSSIEIGKRLKEAKDIVGHGNWTDWLETSVNYSQRTAQNLIRIYEEFNEKYLGDGENSNPQTFANLTYTQAVAMLRLDSDERENFLENNDVTGMSTRELEQAIAEKIAIEEEKKKIIEAMDKMAAANEDLKRQIVETDELQKKLDEMKKNSADPKELERTKDALDKANKEVSKLLKKVAEAEAAGPQIVKEVKEVIPKEVEIEMDKMRTKLAMSEDSAKFKARLDVIINLFNELININEHIRTTDPAMADRYKEAINKVLDGLRQ